MPANRSPEDPPRGYTTEDVAASPPPPPPRRGRRWGLKTIVAGIILIPILVIAAWTWITLHYTYSSGVRAGYVQKLSKKGWLCKTWEGELSQVIPGQAQVIAPSASGNALNTFDFTVRSDSIAKEIENLEGKQVRLTYQQHTHIPFSCFGDTEYFISDVKLVQ